MITVVRLDPTGNITCLVTRKPAEADEAAIIRTLMAECEQVAFLEPPSLPGARARIRLMGGEFCGNAAMASACYLAREDGIQAGEERTVPLEVSGAAGVLSCGVRRTDDGFEGSVPMPRVESVRLTEESGYTLTAVRLEGIVHLILEEETLLEKEAAETLLKRAAEKLPDEAAGLLQWNRETGTMTPLVYVRGSGTMVWETGCGSGSAAIGVREAMLRGDGTHVIRVKQPGGVIRTSAEIRNGRAERIVITGQVQVGENEERKPG